MARLPAGADADRFDRWIAEISDAIVSAGLDPELWKDIPTRFVEGWPGTAVFLQSADSLASRCLGAVCDGWNPELVDAYAAHYCQINPWLPFWSRQPVMRALASDETMPASTFAGTEFHDDFLKGHGDVESAAGIKIFDDRTRFGWLSVHYGSRLARRYNRILPRALQRLAPAFRAAMTLNRELAPTALGKAALGKVLDAIAAPALIVDEQFRLRVANREAAARLEHGDLVRLDSRGRICLSDPAARAKLGALLARLGAASEAVTGDILVRSEEQAVAVLTVFPTSAASPAGNDLAWFIPPERLALILVRQLAPNPVSGGGTGARSVFAFTRAEADLAARLATGEALDEAAGALGIAKETARSQLKSIYAKTGTHRQAALVALLSRLGR